MKTLAVAAMLFAMRCGAVLAAEWPTARPADVGLDETKLAEARDYALTGGGSGCVIRHGKLVFAWGDQKQLYDLKSTTKSFGAAALGLAVGDGKVKLDDPAKKLFSAFGVPPEENAETGWLDKITLRMLATHTAGFEKSGGFGRLLFEPGTRWHYSDGGPNWLADCLTLAYRRDLAELMFERVFAPIGIARDDLRWRPNAYRPRELDGIPRREFGSGISANVQAMARFGLLWLREGRWEDRQLLPRSFIAQARRASPEIARLPVLDSIEQPGHFGPNASAHYGFLWWNNNDETIEGVPLDTYWAWGLFDSLIVVMPTLDIVVARAGKSWRRHKDAKHYDVLRPFLLPIVAAAKSGADSPAKKSSAPYPPSPVIARIEWAPADSVIRLAKGSDNWPMTWADDDALYTAYGDGHGFEPFLKEKLSLGLAKITGTPPAIRGENLRSPTAESKGDGPRGRKASGMLCVDGVLYMLVRNVGNSQLGWSTDHGRTWSWADWKFTESFGCPTFLNFGRNYAGARDGFVYIYSHDHDSAYERADRFVLARVPREKLRDRAAYEFFVRLDARGWPVWSRDIRQRGAVFRNPGACYRSGITYNAALRRYLWCQTGLGADLRYAGGFAIYDAPEPWGPWTTAFFTEQWDVGPGESSSFPAKWMSADGQTLWLVFSGNDSFSVRKATIIR
ncbi:MAG: serine hydrolase [Verrucomicrobiae bacterium]|nr:serine hydrolase [Verrucomicrobiae bacterium]